MKRNARLLFGMLAIALVSFIPAKESNELKIGETSAALKEDVYDFGGNGKALEKYAAKNGLLVVFSCNTCPFVVAWEDRYNEIQELAAKNGINMVLLNSNEAFRDNEDSPINMRNHAADLNYTMPYLIDRNHRIADAFSAKTTPHVFLFDGNLKLAYKGAIDDNHKDKSAVSKTYLADAITALGNGKEIKVKETNALGCSIKRVKK